MMNVQGRMSQWTDQTGNMNHFTQTDVSRMPVLIALGINGRPSLQIFAKNKETMLMPKNLAAPEWSIWYVARMTTLNDGCILAGIYNEWLLGWIDGGQDHYAFPQFALTSAAISHPTVPDNLDSLTYSVVSSPGAFKVYRNALLISSGSKSAQAPNGLQISGYDGQFYADCLISEIVFFPKALTDVERAKVDMYFFNKYK